MLALRVTLPKNKDIFVESAGFFSRQEKGHFMCVMDFSRASMPKKKDLLCVWWIFLVCLCPRIRTFYVCGGFFSCIYAQEKGYFMCVMDFFPCVYAQELGHFMCVMDFSRVSMPKN